MNSLDEAMRKLFLEVLQSPEAGEAINGHLAKYLQENGYKIGYASYWNANVVTEVTDGTVHMIGVTIYTDPEGCIKYYDFLTSQWLREVPNEKPFLLIDHYEALPENMVPYCVQVYADACYSVYDITDLETFRDLLNS